MRMPPMLLLGMMLLVGFYFFLAGKFVPHVQPDTASYVNAPLGSLKDALTNFRMPGYRVLIKIVQTFSPELKAMPLIQFLAFCGAAVALFIGLVALGQNPYAAALVAGSLLLCNMLQNYGRDILSDALAAALGVAAVGMTFYTVSRRGRWWWAILVGTLCTAAWLTRPAYLFLVLLLPLLGMFVTCQGDQAADNTLLRPTKLRALAILGAAVVLPLVAWVGLRWCVIGRADATSGGGGYVLSIVAQFLDPQLAAELPADVRSVAEAVLQRRAELPAGTLVMQDAPLLSYTRIEHNTSATMDYVQEAAQDLYGVGDPRIEPALRLLANEIIKHRPGWYGTYLAKAVGMALSGAVGDVLITPLGLLLGLTTLGVTLVAALRTWRWPLATSAGSQRSLVNLMFVTAVFYYALAMANIIFVCPPVSRMNDGAAVLLPTLLMAVTIERVETLRQRRSPATN